MKKASLIYLRNIIEDLDDACFKLHEMMYMLNLTEEEKTKIEDAMLVTLNKIDNIKQTQIRDLDEHVEIDYLDRIVK